MAQYLKYILFTALFLLFFMIPNSSFSQGMNGVAAKFEQYRKNDLQEKLFVHTSKDFYLPGELIWFKIYDINGALNAPFNFSKVAYVELLNTNHQSVYQETVSISDTAQGSIKIPLSIATGHYVLRAYTSWMKNFSSDYFFNKIITIVNPSQQGGGVSMVQPEKYDVQFLPEGGNLVAGIKSDIGFRATDEYGSGLDFSGVLVDQDGDSILSFKPLKFGIGHFYFTPVGGNKYKAVLHIKDGKTITETLPEAYTNGYVMHVQKNNNQVEITVHTNISGAGNVHLIIQTRGAVKASEELPFRDGVASYTINQDDLGEGISQITVFNRVLQPVCERLFFKKLDRALDIKINPDQGSFGLRNKISLDIETMNEQDKPVSADMSASVYRLDSLQTTDEYNILNYLWLTSDLKGGIQNPAYYFGHAPDADEALDNLMLTQGWRRFNWNDVMNAKPPVIRFAPETNGMVITGRVKNESGQSVKGVLTYLGIPGKLDQLNVSESDAKGFVYFSPTHLNGRQQIVVETNTQSKDSVNNIEVLNPYSKKINEAVFPGYSFDKLNAYQLEQHYIWNQSQHAYHEKMIDRVRLSPVRNTAFYGKPYKTYRLEDYTRYTTMEEVMREYVTEVAVRKRAGHYRFQTMNALFNYDKTASAMLFQNDPLVLLDGVPVFNIDSVMAIDPLKIKTLEVVAGRYFWGPVVADGIVSFTSYSGDMAGFNWDPKALIIDYNSVQPSRQYYSPVYDKANESSTRIPDFRNVLYWSPFLKSDAMGKASCTFYSSDLDGKYVVVINAITADGRAGYGTAYFDVNSR